MVLLMEANRVGWYCLLNYIFWDQLGNTKQTWCQFQNWFETTEKSHNFAGCFCLSPACSIGSNEFLHISHVECIIFTQPEKLCTILFHQECNFAPTIAPGFVFGRPLECWMCLPYTKILVKRPHNSCSQEENWFKQVFRYGIQSSFPE